MLEKNCVFNKGKQLVYQQCTILMPKKRFYNPLIFFSEAYIMRKPYSSTLNVIQKLTRFDAIFSQKQCAEDINFICAQCMTHMDTTLAKRIAQAYIKCM